MRQATTTRRAPSSPRLAVMTTAVSAVTSLGAHWVGSRMTPSGAQVACLALAAAALAVIARLMPRRTSAFTGVLIVGQLLMHAALSVGASLAGVLDGGTAHGAMTAPDAMAGTTHPGAMLAAHVVGTVLAVVIVHLLLRLTAAARCAVSALIARLTRVWVRPLGSARPEWVQPFVPARQWRLVAPLRGPPRRFLRA